MRFDEGDMIAAKQLSERGLQGHEHHPGLLQVAGLAAYHLGEHVIALAKLEMASAISPLCASAQVALADLYARFGKLLTARAILDFLVEPDRCPTPLLPDVARIFGKLRAYREALKVCRRLTRLRSWYHPDHFGIAFYLAKLGRPLHQQIRYLREAHELAPQADLYRITLASALASQASFAEACDVIRSVAVGAITCPGCLHRLCMAAQVVGDTELLERLGERLENLQNQPQEGRDSAGE